MKFLTALILLAVAYMGLLKMKGVSKDLRKTREGDFPEARTLGSLYAKDGEQDLAKARAGEQKSADADQGDAGESKPSPMAMQSAQSCGILARTMCGSQEPRA